MTNIRRTSYGNNSMHTHTHVTCRRIEYAKCSEYLLICDLFYLYVNVNRQKKLCKLNGKKCCGRESVNELAKENNLCICSFSLHIRNRNRIHILFVHDSYMFNNTITNSLTYLLFLFYLIALTK